MLRRFRMAWLMSTMLIAGCASLPEPDRAHGAFVAREVEVGGTLRRYQVFVPSRAASGAKPAVVVFLHGSGEIGTDGVKPTLVGLGPYLRSHQDEFPAIVVFPQLREGESWDDGADFAFAALRAASEEFQGDPDRTYLTGISLGGYGVWTLARLQPQRFAALVPVCGGIGRDTTTAPYAETAQRFRDKPIWIFHGAKDDDVLPEQSRRIAAELKSIGARDARYTEFPDADHNAWDPAYATPELWAWMFAQRPETFDKAPL
ncbi:MAG TPA: prolyl oligopeptidase family serine peptidase [Luteimonas sp.]|nr:prolyl oligopeptidase family serine peptidase [Luteimonas sp.]